MWEAYGVVLSWMQKNGMLDMTRSGTDQLTPALFGAYLGDARQARSAGTVRNGAGSLSMMLRRLAPERDWRWIFRHPLVPSDKDAQASQKVPRFVDVVALLHGLISELDHLREVPANLENAKHRRDFLIVAMAFYTTLRLRNLTALTLGKSFIRRSETWIIRFTADETKRGLPVLKRLPMVLVSHMDRYVAEDRPLLLRGRQSQALWVSNCGSINGLTSDTIGGVFRRVGTTLLGYRITSHQVAILLRPPCWRSTPERKRRRVGC